MLKKLQNLSLLSWLGFLIHLPAVAQDITSNNEIAKISLDEAKRYAVENNYKVQAQVEKLAATRAKKYRAKSGFYPSIGVAGGADHESSGDNSETASVGYVYGNYNLFNGFKDFYAVELAELESEIASVKLMREEFLIELDVEEQFHKYLYFQNLISIKERALEKNREHQKLVARTKRMGQVSETDVMEFDLKESVIQSELFSLKQELENARIHLRRLLGEDVGSKIEPVGDLQHQHIEGELMNYLEQIKRYSIPVQLASKRHSISSINAKIWRSKWLPKIDFQARAGYLPLDERPEAVEGESADTAVSFQLIASLDLFSGMATHWERKETQHLQKKASLGLKDEILTSITEMEESFRELKTIEQRVDLEQGNEEKSRRYYNSVLEEYRRGYKNSADLSAAVDQLFETKSRQSKYKFEFLKQRLAFERALGAPIKVTVINEHEDIPATKGGDK